MCGRSATICHMSTIASRDLRNHTAAVLKQVAEGTEVTVTVHGEPVAVITRSRRRRPVGVAKADLLAFLDGQRVDPDLVEDMSWISAGSTDDLPPLP